ncbi:helix-turn-helix domain-containing protein [Streptomyces sp. NBC_01410]|uniref:helix-turn-helix domain-containing protein n=1 Tax=Streptomyces sp. NBC_01410 TaxID=2903856 RepID=UPI003869CBDA
MASSPSSAVQDARQALGGRLREIRKAGGFRTARAFAARAGWSESKASRIENGVTTPSDEPVERREESWTSAPPADSLAAVRDRPRRRRP